ncbi:hypothetical protein R5M92_03830 [Halomonas sp. Bachu 37]|uniref:hypothetical protein n=1 Tax=Halomonas kashgarensis TaxID=3084920 RepID=UPI0032178D5E
MKEKEFNLNGIAVNVKNIHCDNYAFEDHGLVKADVTISEKTAVYTAYLTDGKINTSNLSCWNESCVDLVALLGNR